jgi:hypothetical protein
LTLSQQDGDTEQGKSVVKLIVDTGPEGGQQLRLEPPLEAMRSECAQKHGQPASQRRQGQKDFGYHGSPERPEGARGYGHSAIIGDRAFVR